LLSCGIEELFLLLRDRKNMPAAMRATAATPPMMPPAMAPAFGWFDGWLVVGELVGTLLDKVFGVEVVGRLAYALTGGEL
jgi:hypothetical protein